MHANLIARQSIRIDASISNVWDALINPAIVKQYMFGTTVSSEWRQGSSIAWKGEWQGKKYEDKGNVLQIIPEKLLQYSHYSPMTGLPDVKENYHTVTIELQQDKDSVLVSLSQDNNATEQAREHSEKNWAMMLSSLKNVLEKSTPG